MVAGNVILANVFAMMAAFCSSSRQAVDSAGPFVALSLPQKLRRLLCVF